MAIVLSEPDYDATLDFDVDPDEIALDEIESNPYGFGLWLRSQTDESAEPLPAYALGDALERGDLSATVPQLVAVLVACPDAQALIALHALRHFYRTHMAEEVRLRSAEISAARERFLRRQKDEWEAER